jgi:hypothetical protein
MNIQELEKRIKKTKSIKDKSERLSELRDITEDVANHFTESMSILEDEITFVLEQTPEHIKDELGYNDVQDVTRDIDVHSSWEY